VGRRHQVVHEGGRIKALEIKKESVNIGNDRTRGGEIGASKYVGKGKRIAVRRMWEIKKQFVNNVSGGGVNPGEKTGENSGAFLKSLGVVVKEEGVGGGKEGGITRVPVCLKGDSAKKTVYKKGKDKKSTSY